MNERKEQKLKDEWTQLIQGGDLEIDHFANIFVKYDLTLDILPETNVLFEIGVDKDYRRALMHRVKTIKMMISQNEFDEQMRQLIMDEKVNEGKSSSGESSATTGVEIQPKCVKSILKKSADLTDNATDMETNGVGKRKADDVPDIIPKKHVHFPSEVKIAKIREIPDRISLIMRGEISARSASDRLRRHRRRRALMRDAIQQTE